MNIHPFLQWFKYMHLPNELQGISRSFYSLAYDMVAAGYGDTTEGTASLRKLLEAKDAALRAHIEMRETGKNNE